MNGLLIVNKEKDCTSRDVVNDVSKILGVRKIGHTGTLDPMATGVLVLCVGKCTKLVDVITSDCKEYVADVCLGYETDTLDVTGTKLRENSENVTKEEVITVLNSMIGCYDQEVPIYSAVKIDGKKLYEYARNNISIDLPKRNVCIQELELVSELEYKDNCIYFKIRCLVSKGTYIRSLIRDIAYRLGTLGVMASLERVKQGNFTIDEAFSVSDIKNGNYKLIDLRTYFKDMYTIKVEHKMKVDILNGKIIDNNYKSDKVLFIDENDLVLAIYSVYDKDNSKMKPFKMFGGIK